MWKNVRFNRGGGEGGGEKESLFFFFVDIDGSAKARLEISRILSLDDRPQTDRIIGGILVNRVGERMR